MSGFILWSLACFITGLTVGLYFRNKDREKSYSPFEATYTVPPGVSSVKVTSVGGGGVK